MLVLFPLSHLFLGPQLPHPLLIEALPDPPGQAPSRQCPRHSPPLSVSPTTHCIDKKTEAGSGSHSQQGQNRPPPGPGPHLCLTFPGAHLCRGAGCHPAGPASTRAAPPLWPRRGRGAFGRGAAGTGGSSRAFPGGGRAPPACGLLKADRGGHSCIHSFALRLLLHQERDHEILRDPRVGSCSVCVTRAVSVFPQAGCAQA